MDGNIVQPYITEFIRNLIPEHEGLLKDLETFAKENRVPIVSPEVGQLLSTVVEMKKPERILEVGTAIGYSALLMSAAAPNAEITTLELRDEWADIAEDNFQKAGKNERIKVIRGNAVETLKDLEGPYDFIFLDAAKGQYLEFYEQSMRMLKSDGIIFSDNVLYRGMVASRALLIRRKITIVKRLQKYLKQLSVDKRLTSAILSVGDGVAISYRKGGQDE